jgi:hypothetical protein
MTSSETQKVDCAVSCVNGCILGENCPNQAFKAQASEFIQNTSLDDLLAIAQAAVLKKMSAPPQWVLPEEDSEG